MSLKDWIRFIVLGLIWGSSFLWIKMALAETGPFTLVAFRVAFALLGLTVVVLVQRPSLPPRRVWKVFFLLGLTNIVIPFVLISWSELHITSGLASILNSTSPLFTILIASIFLTDERLTPQRVAGLLMGFCGVILLTAKHFSAGERFYLLGIGGMLLAALSYAISAVVARRKLMHLTPDIQAFSQQFASALVIIPLAAMVEAPLRLPVTFKAWFALAFLGVMGSCVATMLYYSLLKSVGPTRTMLVTYMFPLVGVLLGLVFLSEPISWRLVAGGCLIVGGILVVNRRLPRAEQTRRALDI